LRIGLELISCLALFLENVYPFPVVRPTLIPWDFFLILIVLGTLVAWRGAVRVKHLLGQPAPGAAERLSLYGSTIVYQWFIVAVVAWRAFSRKLGLAEVGLTVSDPGRTAWIAVVLTALLCANQWASLRRMTRVPDSQRGLLFRISERIMPRTSAETIAFAALACTAGLSEEFLYRGFVFTVFAHMFAGSAVSIMAAAVLSSAWFAIAHLYQGRRGLITTFIVGILFSVVRIWSGSLIPSMAAHAGMDLIAGICLSNFFRTVKA
jgi:membrane protease YdiL (CAAX protease family)